VSLYHAILTLTLAIVR